MGGAPPLVSSQGVGSGGAGHTTAPPSLAPPMYNPTGVKGPKGAAPRQHINGAHAGEAQQAPAQQYAENFTTSGGAAHPQGAAPQAVQAAQVCFPPASPFAQIESRCQEFQKRVAPSPLILPLAPLRYPAVAGRRVPPLILALSLSLSLSLSFSLPLPLFPSHSHSLSPAATPPCALAS